MKQIGTRSFVKTYNRGDWDLHLHLILGDQFNFLIDTGLGSESIAPFLPLLAENPKPLLVVNTHHHWDHMWGNHCFPGSVIVAHRSCFDLAREHWDEMIEQNARHICGEVALCLPNLLFDDELVFPADGIRIFHSPGHTADCISVYDERDRVLNAGDNIGDNMEEIVPHLDLPDEVYINTLRRYEELDVDVCISGHNELTDSHIFRRIRQAVTQGTDQ